MAPLAETNFCEYSQSTMDFSGWEIYIISEMLFQSSIMGSVLSRELGIPCYSKKAPESSMLEKDCRRLVLFDLQNFDPSDDISALIGPVFEKPSPGCPIALFNSRREIRYYKHVIMSMGVRGIFFENESLDKFLKGITYILKDNHWFPRELLNQWIKQSRSTLTAEQGCDPVLTGREKEILLMVSTGASNEEVSEKMHISYHTVKKHLSNIYAKLKVSSRVEASLWSARNL